jgi:glycosyltransferase involved in cell wall biosynthesis
MKITVITVTYNSSSTIRDTLESVKNQDCSNIEHIIIDGASTDATVSIAKTYPSVSRIISEPDKGIYDAMNKGIALAEGDVIGILNSDDVFASDTILSKIRAIFEDSTIDTVYGNIIFFKTGEENNVLRHWRTKPYYNRFFEDGEVPPHPALFVRKKVYDAIGLYDADFKICADHEFMLRMLKFKGYKSFFVDETLVKMRIGGVSTNGWRSYWITTWELKKAWEMNGQPYPFRLYFLRPFKKLKQLIFKKTV